MSLPDQLESTFSPEEIQFIVENEPIRIFPRITTRKTKRPLPTGGGNNESVRWKLITTNDYNVNNMVAMQSTEVTLWLALLLKQQNKCSIVAPSWLTLKELDRSIQYEKTHADRFCPVPWNWLVLAQVLFKRAPEHFHDPVHELRAKVQDLREVRQLKVLRGLRHLNESHLQLDNLSLLEINELRPFIVNVMDKLRQLHVAKGTMEDEEEG
ncbi:DNA replication protein psf2 [Zygosaccharomyces mellis]|uniref:DNA replication complex GINS protein PSF2 n=1 Tax=Zygosaccharomyces mellis TaxID=42258 RepID=A0A4C2EBN2_9SACH|nr:DNA replication protein psf2 [Zygosaccharomyces mellis]